MHRFNSQPSNRLLNHLYLKFVTACLVLSGVPRLAEAMPQSNKPVAQPNKPATEQSVTQQKEVKSSRLLPQPAAKPEPVQDANVVQELNQIRKMMGGGISESLQGVVSEKEAEEMFARGLREAMAGDASRLTSDQLGEQELPKKAPSDRVTLDLPAGRRPGIRWQVEESLPQPTGYPAWAGEIKRRFQTTKNELAKLRKEVQELLVKEKDLEGNVKLAGVELGVVKSRLGGVPDAGFVRPGGKKPSVPELQAKEGLLSRQLKEGRQKLDAIRAQRKVVEDEIQAKENLLSLFRGAMESAADRWEPRNWNERAKPAGQNSSVRQQPRMLAVPPRPFGGSVVLDRQPNRAGRGPASKVATLRNAARTLDETAAELEEQEMYEEADQLRDLAAKLRQKARTFK